MGKSRAKKHSRRDTDSIKKPNKPCSNSQISEIPFTRKVTCPCGNTLKIKGVVPVPAVKKPPKTIKVDISDHNCSSSSLTSDESSSSDDNCSSDSSKSNRSVASTTPSIQLKSDTGGNINSNNSDKLAGDIKVIIANDFSPTRGRKEKIPEQEHDRQPNPVTRQDSGHQSSTRYKEGVHSGNYNHYYNKNQYGSNDHKYYNNNDSFRKGWSTNFQRQHVSHNYRYRYRQMGLYHCRPSVAYNLNPKHREIKRENEMEEGEIDDANSDPNSSYDSLDLTKSPRKSKPTERLLHLTPYIKSIVIMLDSRGRGMGLLLKKSEIAHVIQHVDAVPGAKLTTTRNRIRDLFNDRHINIRETRAFYPLVGINDVINFRYGGQKIETKPYSPRSTIDYIVEQSGRLGNGLKEAFGEDKIVVYGTFIGACLEKRNKSDNPGEQAQQLV